MFLFWSHSCKRILVDNKLDDFNHELLEIFTNTNLSNDTNLEPTALLLERFIYIRSIRLIRVRFNTCLSFYEHEFFE